MAAIDRALTGLKTLTNRSKTKDLSQLALALKEYPTETSSYEILDDCGKGVSATVHRALCVPFNEIVAIKLMNLESMTCDLDEIIHEAQTMKNYNHPNVLPLYTSFVAGQDLWMVMPFVAGGSVLHIMKYNWPDGLDEPVIATIVRDVLKGLDYVHKQGGIHRDIKAGNILVDKDGSVKLADFGVAATMERSGSWGHDKATRMTFVGTPCWMAPEVMEQTSGYDQAADIWSVGITLLELAHGCAPFAKFPPMKVLLMTLQNPPPTLDDKGKKHFSKAMRDLVSKCLQKEPEKRPTAAQLLEHKFFKIARDEDFLVRNLLDKLPSLAERVNLIRSGKAATSKDENDRNLAKSNEEYKKGVSSWNFDLAALKAQAALEPDEDGKESLPTIRESDETDTLSGAAAESVALFVSAQAAATDTTPMLPRPGSGSGSGERPSLQSAFASVQGQVPAAASTSTGPASFPVVVPTALDGFTFEEKPASDLAGPLSPETSSPAPLSRQGSSQGLSQAAAMGSLPVNTPPNVMKQKKGRFAVYEHGEPVPPMSPVVASHMEMAGSMLSMKSDQLPPAAGSGANISMTSARASEDGVRLHSAPPGLGARVSELAREESGKEVDESGQTIEPKQRGRFKIVSESSDARGSMSKTSSSLNLADAATKSKSDGGSVLGKPPTAPPPPGTAAALPPVTVMLPKLQELVDHAAAHHAALQKLLGAVQDAEKGRIPQLLSRSTSSKLLLTTTSEKDYGDGGGVASVEDLRAQLTDFKARVQQLEEENTRLKVRNTALEQLFGPEGGAAGGSTGGSTAPSATGASFPYSRPASQSSLATEGPMHALHSATGTLPRIASSQGVASPPSGPTTDTAGSSPGIVSPR